MCSSLQTGDDHVDGVEDRLGVFVAGGGFGARSVEVGGEVFMDFLEEACAFFQGI